MSQPSELLIHFSQSDPAQSIECQLDKQAATALYHFMLPEMAKINPDYEGQLIGEFAGGVFTVDFVKAKDFGNVYQIIMQAAQQLEEIKPFIGKLKSGLEQDTRFQAA